MNSQNEKGESMMDKQEKLYFVYAEGKANTDYQHHFVIQTNGNPLKEARKVFHNYFNLKPEAYYFQCFEMKQFPYIFD